MKLTDAPVEIQNYLKLIRRSREPADGELWFAEGDDRCAICGWGAPLVWDHCHASGLLRGHICRACNTLEGTSPNPIWTFWRLNAPLLSNREAYDMPGPDLTESEVMELPIADMLQLERRRRLTRQASVGKLIEEGKIATVVWLDAEGQAS